MNAVTVPSDTRVRARLERELIPGEGRAKGRRRKRSETDRETPRGSPIKCGEPRLPWTCQRAAPTGRRMSAGLEREQAGADPSAQRIHRENWRARIPAVERATYAPPASHIADQCSAASATWPVSRHAGTRAQARRHVPLQAALARMVRAVRSRLRGERAGSQRSARGCKMRRRRLGPSVAVSDLAQATQGGA